MILPREGRLMKALRMAGRVIAFPVTSWAVFCDFIDQCMTQGQIPGYRDKTDMLLDGLSLFSRIVFTVAYAAIWIDMALAVYGLINGRFI